LAASADEKKPSGFVSLLKGYSSVGRAPVSKTGCRRFQRPDGEPAVFASEVIEPPIFMAVLGSRKLGGWGKKELPGFGFYISVDDITRAKREGWTGYVYVLDRKAFEKRSGWEWRSSNVVRPLRAVEVGIKDLPPQIEVMSHNDYMAIVQGRNNNVSNFY
jgi:hypothetical protein